MSWRNLFTSMDGRIGRKEFWIGVLCLLLPELIAHLAIGQRWASAASLLLAYPALAVLTKRARDRDVPLWVPGLFVAGGILSDVLNLLDLLGPPETPNLAFYIVGIPFGILGLILLVDLGFRRGTVGANRHGPDPLPPG